MLSVDAQFTRGRFSARAVFEAPAGETVAILGPNGAGKSTILLGLAGLLTARGRVRLSGRFLDHTDRGIRIPPERRPIGVAFQDRRLLPHLSVVENVAFTLRARGARRVEAQRRALSALERLGIAGLAPVRPKHLSGGEAQRVTLARALVSSPELLLLDEPTSALDIGARPRVRSLLSELLEALPGVRLVVTHDPREAMVLADRVVVVEDGTITQQGSFESIRRAPTSRYAAELVGVNVFRGQLMPLDAGIARLETPGGDLVVRPSREGSGASLGLLRPSDVSLHGATPSDSSARNVLHGVVTALEPAGPGVRVFVDGPIPVVAEVTWASLDRLGIKPGRRIWASFKVPAVEVVRLD